MNMSAVVVVSLMSLPAEIDLRVFPVKLEGDTVYIGIESGSDT